MKIPFALCLLTLAATSNAQVSVNAGGGDGTSGAGSASHSIGQPFFNLDTGNGSVQKGVQVPLVIEVVGVHAPEIKSIISIFPNPTATTVFVTVDKNILNRDISLLLYGIDHRLIHEAKVNAAKTEISFQGLASGTYLIILKGIDAAPTAFKITKTD